MSRHSSRLLLRPSFRNTITAVATSLALLMAGLPGASLAQQGADPRYFEREWQVLQYRDATNGLTEVPPGISVTMLPYGGVMKGEGACSDFVADYDLIEDNVRVFPPQIEARGCDSAAQAIDDAFYAGLGDVVKWSTQGGGSILRLQDPVDNVVMLLTRAELPADPTLARWDLARLGALDGSIEPVIQGTEPWVEFGRGGWVVGDTGCGSFLGTYTTNDTTISIEDVDTRLADCSEAARDQAERILASLTEITDFEVRPAGLVLEDASGLTRMALVPTIDLGRRTWTPTEVLATDGTVAVGAERLITSAVKFLGGKTDGRSICRPFEGDSVRSGLALSVFDVSPTRGECPEPTDETKVSNEEVEKAYLDALGRTASHALRGEELELMDVDGNPVMRLIPQAELVGPTWVLKEMDVTPDARKQKLRPPTGTVPLTAIFENPEFGLVQGETGFTGYYGEYATPGAGQISVSGIVTDQDCSRRQQTQAPCRQQELFLDLLQAADSFIVQPGELRLFKESRKLLGFAPYTPAAEATRAPSPEPGPEG